MRTQNETPFYIRTADGDTFHVETLEEALTEFSGPDGYRLTLMAGNQELVIRRSGEAEIDEADDILSHQSYKANVTLKKKTV